MLCVHIVICIQNTILKGIGEGGVKGRISYIKNTIALHWTTHSDNRCIFVRNIGTVLEILSDHCEATYCMYNV